MINKLKDIFKAVSRRFKPEYEKFYTYTNPDGTEGGRVAENSIVDPTATVEKYGIVLPGAKVGPNVIVKAGDMVTDTGYHLRFD